LSVPGLRPHPQIVGAATPQGVAVGILPASEPGFPARRSAMGRVKEYGAFTNDAAGAIIPGGRMPPHWQAGMPAATNELGLPAEERVVISVAAMPR